VYARTARPPIDSPCECEHKNPDCLDARLFSSVVLAVAPALTMDDASSLLHGLTSTPPFCVGTFTLRHARARPSDPRAPRAACLRRSPPGGLHTRAGPRKPIGGSRCVSIYRYTYTHVYTNTYIYIYIYMHPAPEPTSSSSRTRWA